MGTPDFALASLKALHKAGHELVGAVTQPDKPKGRGYTLTPPPVKVYALENSIPVYQPATLKQNDGNDFEKLLHDISPELIVVAAYGKILPKYVLDYPKYGCINVHGSLLPKYRGAAPIQRAIMAGETVVGVTIMHMAEGLDTGDMIAKESVEITEEDNFETVHDRLAELGAELLVRTINAIADGSASREPQNDADSSYAAKIEKSDCRLDFSMSAEKLAAYVRGLSPFPLAFAYLNGKILKIVSARAESYYGDEDAEFGTVTALDGEITVRCGSGALKITRVIPEGKGAMSSADFIRGRKIAVGDRLQCEK